MLTCKTEKDCCSIGNLTTNLQDRVTNQSRGNLRMAPYLGILAKFSAKCVANQQSRERKQQSCRKITCCVYFQRVRLCLFCVKTFGMAVVYRLQTPLTLLGVWDLRFQRPYKVSERGPIAVLGFCSFQPQSLGIRIWYEQIGGDLAFLHDVPRAFRCSTRGGEQMGAEGDRMEPWCQWKGWSLGIHMATHIGLGQICKRFQQLKFWFAQKFQETTLKNRESYHAFIFGSSLPVVLTGLRIRDVNCNAGPWTDMSISLLASCLFTRTQLEF